MKDKLKINFIESGHETLKSIKNTQVYLLCTILQNDSFFFPILGSNLF